MATKTEANVNADSISKRPKLPTRLPKEQIKLNPRKKIRQPKPDRTKPQPKPNVETLSNIYPSDIEKPEVKLDNLYKKQLKTKPSTLGEIDNVIPADVTVTEIENINPEVKATNKVSDIQDIDTTVPEKKTLGNLNVYGEITNRSNPTSLPNVND